MSQPRLLIFTQYFPPELGAPQARLSELAVRLVHAGWQVEVLTALPNYPGGKVLPGYGRWRPVIEGQGALRVVRAPLWPSSRGFRRRVITYLSFALFAVATAVRRTSRPDLIYAESPPLTVGLAARVLARFWRTRYVLNVSDLWPDSVVELGVLGPEGMPVRVLRWAEQWVYEGATGITGQSTSIVSHVATRAPDVPTAVITNGVDPQLFQPRPPPSGDVSSRGVDRPIFLYAGLLGHAQGLEQIIDVAETLGDDGPARFVIVGDGPVRVELEHRLATMSASTVELRGPVPRDDMPALLSSADVCFITLGAALTGAVPSKLYEAMASGVPILLAATGEAQRRVTEAQCGLVVEPWRINELADAVRMLASDRALRTRLGDAGRRAAETTYARDRIGEELDRFLRARLNGT